MFVNKSLVVYVDNPSRGTLNVECINSLRYITTQYIVVKKNIVIQYWEKTLMIFYTLTKAYFTIFFKQPSFLQST